jgi:hypothetical protein
MRPSSQNCVCCLYFPISCLTPPWFWRDHSFQDFLIHFVRLVESEGVRCDHWITGSYLLKMPTMAARSNTKQHQQTIILPERFSCRHPKWHLHAVIRSKQQNIRWHISRTLKVAVFQLLFLLFIRQHCFVVKPILYCIIELHSQRAVKQGYPNYRPWHPTSFWNMRLTIF